MADSVTLFAPALRAGFHDRENFVTEIEEQGRCHHSYALAAPGLPCGPALIRKRLTWPSSTNTGGHTHRWHRDAPQYDVVAGISLLSNCIGSKLVWRGAQIATHRAPRCRGFLLASFKLHDRPVPPPSTASRLSDSA
jgi:hypothetical protein